MKRLFAVVRGRGPAWNNATPLGMQEGWRAHADFMNGLAAEGLIVAGGPIEDNGDTLLIVRAADADEIRARLSADLWREDLRPLLRIAPSSVLLGEHRFADLSA